MAAEQFNFNTLKLIFEKKETFGMRIGKIEGIYQIKNESEYFN